MSTDHYSASSQPSTSATLVPVSSHNLSLVEDGASKPKRAKTEQQYHQLVSMPDNFGSNVQQYIVLGGPSDNGYQTFQPVQFIDGAYLNVEDQKQFIQQDGQQYQVVFTDQVYSSTSSVAVPPDESKKDDGPSFVNPKQYHRIIQRRSARAKLIMEGRISSTRKKYLHESRHKHAVKRNRGGGGKFEIKKDQSPTPATPTQSVPSLSSSTSHNQEESGSQASEK